MRCPSLLTDEADRLSALAEYGLSQDVRLPSLEPLVELAAHAFDTPVAAINLIGKDHVFFAASTGIGECDMRRDVSFCAHAITKSDMMVVLDARQDERFHDNPLVTSSSPIIFYAGVPLRAPSGQPIGALCVVDSNPRTSFGEAERERLRSFAELAKEKLELRRLEVANESQEENWEKMLRNSPRALLAVDEEDRIILLNGAGQRLLGYTQEEVLGLDVRMIVPGIERHPQMGDFRSSLPREAAPGGSGREFAVKQKQGRALTAEVTLFHWPAPMQKRISVSFNDVTERHRQLQQIHRLENFDRLTSLQNRAAFLDALSDQLKRRGPLGLILIDVDNFKDINNTIGQAAGDELLQLIAQRIQSRASVASPLARMGGDEFALILAGDADEFRTRVLGRTILAGFAEPFTVAGVEVRLSVSCGISLAPDHGSTSEELLANADLALFEAKQRGRAELVVFTPSLRTEAEARRQSDLELHHAFEQKQFVNFYQPQIRVTDGAVVGAEALIRWHHPERGLIAPGNFLPHLERNPLSLQVGNWVLDEACAQVARWKAAGLHAPRMGVNLFASQLLSPGFAQNVLSTMARHQLEPSELELEITETIILDQPQLILEPLRRLRAAGVGIAFDDFGTGYASLSLLKQYPLSRIKIDQVFVRSMQSSLQDAGTVEAMIMLARIYRLEVIAEGVETQEQAGLLSGLGCDEIQGFLYGRPVAAEEFEAGFLKK